MDKSILREFWNCGDNQLIEFAISRARLNRREKEVLLLVLDECLTQEQVAESLYMSVRNTQELWYNACKKMLSIPWVVAYGMALKKER